MKYRKLGSSGIDISMVSFGTMRWQTEQAAYEIINKGIDLGMNYLDTSTGYVDGKSLVWSGKAVQQRRDEVYFSCKSDWASAPKADHVRRSVESSLEKAGLDYFDFYQVWGLQQMSALESALAPGGMIEGLRKAQDDGLIRTGIGFTFHGDGPLFKAAVDTGEFLCATVSYNIIKRQEEELIRYAHEKGVGIFCMNPLAGGVLGKPEDESLAFLHEDGDGPWQGALRFLWANPGITAGLLGFTDLSQVEADIATLENIESLGDDYRKALVDRLAEVRLPKGAFCTGCGYCHDCPNGFDPTEFMQIMRDFDISGMAADKLGQYLRNRYIGRDVAEWLDECIGCGICEDNCPQHLGIIAQIERARAAVA